MILLTLLLVVCCIPFEYSFSGQKYETYFLEGKISWIFGGFKAGIALEFHKKLAFSLQLLGFHLSPQNSQKDKAKVKKKKDHTIRKEKQKKGTKLHITEFLSKELFEAACRFIAAILKHMRPRDFLIHGSIGFDEPYYTGIFWGGLNMLYPFLKDFDIQIVPIFHEEKLEGRFIIQGKIIIGIFILLGIKLLLSKPGRSTIIYLIKNKKEAKAYVI
jgi:hypothetical protein